MLQTTLVKILSELIDGSAAEGAWALNPKDPGLLASLDRLSAEEASSLPPGGGASIAAHVDHLRYGLELVNRWSRGEEPFADADYTASWGRITVSEVEWKSRREELRREAYAVRDTLTQPRQLSDVEATGLTAVVVHLAYHFGAIRQINRSARGPSAEDSIQPSRD